MDVGSSFWFCLVSHDACINDMGSIRYYFCVYSTHCFTWNGGGFYHCNVEAKKDLEKYNADIPQYWNHDGLDCHGGLFYRHHAFRQLFRPIYEEYIRFLFWWTKIFLVVNYHVDRSDRCREP